MELMFRSDDEARGYLAGLIDGEGTVTNRPDIRKVSIANTDRDILARAAAACDRLGIEHSIYSRAACKSRPDHWADCCDLVIYGRRNLEKLHELPLGSRKGARLRDLLATYKHRYRRKSERPYDDLREMADDGMTIAEMASRLGASRGTVHRWMCEADIPRRPRGGAGHRKGVV